MFTRVRTSNLFVNGDLVKKFKGFSLFSVLSNNKSSVLSYIKKTTVLTLVSLIVLQNMQYRSSILDESLEVSFVVSTQYVVLW